MSFLEPTGEFPVAGRTDPLKGHLRGYPRWKLANFLSHIHMHVQCRGQCRNELQLDCISKSKGGALFLFLIKTHFDLLFLLSAVVTHCKTSPDQPFILSKHKLYWRLLLSDCKGQIYRSWDRLHFKARLLLSTAPWWSPARASKQIMKTGCQKRKKGRAWSDHYSRDNGQFL